MPNVGAPGVRIHSHVPFFSDLLGEAAAYLARLDLASATLSDSLPLPMSPIQLVTGSPQQGRVLWTIVGQHVVALRSDEPVLHVTPMSGGTTREVRMPITLRQLSEREIALRISRDGGLATMLRPGGMAFTNDLVALGDSIFGFYHSDLWRAEEDVPLPEGLRLWRLMSVSGRYLGWFKIPEGLRPIGAQNGAVWTTRPDHRGVPVIAKGRLTPIPK